MTVSEHGYAFVGKSHGPDLPPIHVFIDMVKNNNSVDEFYDRSFKSLCFSTQGQYNQCQILPF